MINPETRENVERAANQVTGFGEMGGVASAVTAVAWGLVAIAEALEKDPETKT